MKAEALGHFLPGAALVCHVPGPTRTSASVHVPMCVMVCCLLEEEELGEEKVWGGTGISIGNRGIRSQIIALTQPLISQTTVEACVRPRGRGGWR